MPLETQNSSRSLTKTLRNLHNRLNDYAFGIQTEDSGPHEPVHYATLEHFLPRARKLTRLQTFVDVGCGKGRACFYAQRWFDVVYGIERDYNLCEAARFNVPHVTILNKDARYTQINVDCVIFMFNPFEQDVMDSFIDENGLFIKLIIYINDVCTLEGFEPVYRLGKSAIYAPTRM